MFLLFSRLRSALVVLTVLTIVACATAKPTLISKSAAVPSGVDLSGMWLVRSNQSTPRVSNSDSNPDGFVIRDRSSRSRKRQDSSEASVRVFLEFGQSLKITQTYFGFFISYDRSIVEEYSYGENRMVSVGPIEAVRVSGWESSSFVVETLDDDGSKLQESWNLERDDEVLIRNIRISKGEQEIYRQQQVFDRQ
jgi:hypothetical protein